MLNSTMQSTKSGGPLAAAWAVTRNIGTDGYARLAGEAREATLAVAISPQSPSTSSHTKVWALQR